MRTVREAEKKVEAVEIAEIQSKGCEDRRERDRRPSELGMSIQTSSSHHLLPSPSCPARPWTVLPTSD